jgi:hypothetical protein
LITVSSLLSALDLPLITGKGAVKRASGAFTWGSDAAPMST